MPHGAPATPRGFSAPLVHSLSPPAPLLSPTPAARKATAMFRKRRRDWRPDQHDDDDDELRGQRTDVPPTRLRRHAPTHAAHPDGAAPSLLQDARRRPSLPPPLSPSSWSSASGPHSADHKPTQRHERSGHDDEDEEHGEEPSVYREIQRRVDQVGAQVAQAQRDVAELRALLLQVAASEPSRSSTARVRIDRLCS